MKGVNLYFIKKLLLILLVFITFIIFGFVVYYNSSTDIYWLHIYLLIGTAVVVLNSIWIAYLIYNKNFKFAIRKARGLLKDFDCAYDYILYSISGYVFVPYIQKVCETLEKEQFNEFVEDGYKIVLGTHKDLKKLGVKEIYAGLFDKYHKHIYIVVPEHVNLPESYAILQKIYAIFYHEWGHYLDLKNDMLSESSVVKKEYVKHKKDVCSNMTKLEQRHNFFSRFNKKSLLGMNEIKNSGEFFADEYSRYKRGYIVPEEMIKIYKKIDLKVGCTI